MSNPYLIQIPFCNAGSKNTIQITRQPTQDPEDATYTEGFPPVTMLPEESEGIPPKGLDFNGIFYELSSPVVHFCQGGRIKYDAVYATAIGGYPKDVILQSNDGSREYISLVDNNTVDPNGSGSAGFWSVYAGVGSVPTATSTTTGTVKLVNSLASTATDAALTAAQGKILQDTKLNTSQALGVGQSWQDVKSSRFSGVTYTNNTGKPIQIFVCGNFDNGSMVLGGVTFPILDAAAYSFVNVIIPNGTTYRMNLALGSSEIISWAELR